MLTCFHPSPPPQWKCVPSLCPPFNVAMDYSSSFPLVGPVHTPFGTLIIHASWDPPPPYPRVCRVTFSAGTAAFFSVSPTSHQPSSLRVHLLLQLRKALLPAGPRFDSFGHFPPTRALIHPGSGFMVVQIPVFDLIARWWFSHRRVFFSFRGHKWFLFHFFLRHHPESSFFSHPYESPPFVVPPAAGTSDRSLWGFDFSMVSLFHVSKSFV